MLGDEFDEQTLNATDDKAEWKLVLKVNGLVTVGVQPTNAKELAERNIQIHNGQSMKQLKVGKSRALEIGSVVVGYIYFAAWMVSLYPIVLT